MEFTGPAKVCSLGYLIIWPLFPLYLKTLASTVDFMKPDFYSDLNFLGRGSRNFPLMIYTELSWTEVFYLGPFHNFMISQRTVD